MRVASVEAETWAGAVGPGPGCGGVQATCSAIHGVPPSSVHPGSQTGQPWWQGSPGVAASAAECCPGPWTPDGLAWHPGVPGSLAGSEGTELGQGLPQAAHGSAAAAGTNPAVLGKNSDWLAARGCQYPRQHRCGHMRQPARPGGPMWLRGTRTAQGHLGPVAPVGTAGGSSGCLEKEQEIRTPWMKRSLGVPGTQGWAEKPLGGEQEAAAWSGSAEAGRRESCRPTTLRAERGRQESPMMPGRGTSTNSGNLQDSRDRNLPDQSMGSGSKGLDWGWRTSPRVPIGQARNSPS